MAYIDVKITDLTQLSSLKNNDMFLVSQAVYDSGSGSLDLTMPYTSNSISYEDLKHSIESADLSIESNWDFVGGKDNIPTQNTKLEISGLVRALEDAEKLSSIVNDENEDGWYNKLSSSVLQKSPIDSSDSLSVTNNSIPNVDFVERAIAGAYQSLIKQITTIIAKFVPSHVGEIIYSTTLSSEELVKEVYGNGQVINGITCPNTHWIRHQGYFLRGNEDGDSVLSNHANNDGGQNSRTYNVPLPTHYHVLGSNASSKTSVTGSVGTVTGVSVTTVGVERPSVPITVVQSVKAKSGTTSISNGKTTFNSGARTESAGEDSATIEISNLPKYKNVYIWERIS